jgi:hypothetical protein
MLRSDIPRAKESLLAECLGVLMNDCLTGSVSCVNRTVHTLYGGVFFNMEAFYPQLYSTVARNFSMMSNTEMLAKYLLFYQQSLFLKMFQQ